MNTLLSHESKTRSPEVYRYLGLVALALDTQTDKEYLYQQVTTELAESLDSPMATQQPIVLKRTVDGKMHDANGASMADSLDAWKDMWLEQAAYDDRHSWFAAIAAAEADEQTDIANFSLAANDGDVMLVISPFPEDAYNDPATRDTVNAHGFRSDIQRSFIRLYEKRGDEVLEHIQSIDTSSVAIWNTVLEKMNISTAHNAQSLLEKRTLLKPKDTDALLKWIVEAYDEQLYFATGQRHAFGRKSGGTTEANSFVLRYPEIIDATIAELRAIDAKDPYRANRLTEQVLYKSKALLDDLHSKHMQGVTVSFKDGSVNSARSEAGATASAAGKIYSGCSGITQSTVTTGEAIDASSSFTVSLARRVANGLEVRSCTKCPVCGHVVDAVYDPKNKLWSCERTACDGYNESMIARARGRTQKHPQKDFGDLLVEFFFGSDKKQTTKNKKVN